MSEAAKKGLAAIIKKLFGIQGPVTIGEVTVQPLAEAPPWIKEVVDELRKEPSAFDCNCEACSIERAMREGRSIKLNIRPPTPEIDALERSVMALLEKVRSRTGTLSETEINAIAHCALRIEFITHWARAGFMPGAPGLKTEN